MRILWIGKEPETGGAGDEVFDSKTISATRTRGHAVDLFHPHRVGPAHEAFNLLMGIPHARARYSTRANLARLRQACSGYDIVVSSWEPFDWLALQLGVPVILILHNITSRSLPVLFPGSFQTALLAKRVRQWEQRHYRQTSTLKAVGVLSRRDQSYIQSLDGHPPVAYLPPGMPPASELNPAAALRLELLILGTYDWRPKGRDLTRFAQEYAASGMQLPILADRLPPQAEALLKPLPAPTKNEVASAVRFGLITDRFESGHKLKTSAYVAGNNIVLSFADVSFDFDHIPDHELFIRRVHSVDEMRAHISDIQAMPWPALRERFARFKHRCAEDFTWSKVAENLSDILERTA